MGKDPAIMFYPQDFLTGIYFLSDSQVGKYIKLLCLQHQQGGILPKNVFESFIGDDLILKTKFIETDDGYFNERLMAEMTKRSIKSTNLSSNAKKRWAKHNINKEQQNKSNANAMQLHMPTEDEDESKLLSNKQVSNKQVSNNSIDQQSEFTRAWELYPRREGRKQALRSFLTSVKTKDDLVRFNRALENYISYKSDSEFIHAGKTWFNNWEDYVDFEIPQTVEEKVKQRKFDSEINAIQRTWEKDQANARKFYEKEDKC